MKLPSPSIRIALVPIHRGADRAGESTTHRSPFGDEETVRVAGLSLPDRVAATAALRMVDQ